MYFPDEVFSYNIGIDVGCDNMVEIGRIDGEKGYGDNTLYKRLEKINGIWNIDYDTGFVGDNITITIDAGCYTGEKLEEIHEIISEYLNEGLTLYKKEIEDE